MKNRAVPILAAMAAVVVLALPAAAGDGHGCTASTQDCLDHMAAKLANRGWVGLEMDDDSMRISKVVDGSPAAAAGFAVGDVLKAANGVEYSEANQDKLNEIKQAMTPGTTMTFTVERGGSTRDLQVTLAPLPDNIRAQWVGNHMLEHVSPKVAAK